LQPLQITSAMMACGGSDGWPDVEG